MSKRILEHFAVEANLEYRKCIELIMSSLYFRKLADKTQVVISLTGPNVRTRLTHTVEVVRIARELCADLGLNEDLAEAIALAHDIGHTPFGHVGERTLRYIMSGCDTLDGNIEIELYNQGFKHNMQSFRVLSDIFDKHLGKEKYYILWGVATHSSMTWTKKGFGFDKEIMIHTKSCPRIFNCNFKRENSKNGIDNNSHCRLNYKDINTNKAGLVCVPWICCDLHVDGNKEYSKCKEPCKFSELWKYRKENYDSYINLKYLFDLPFPNIFYAGDFHSTFYNGSNPDFISFEAAIVAAADEIAQRKQDLDDGIFLKLIDLKELRKNIFEIYAHLPKSKKRGFRKNIINANDSKISTELEKILRSIYIHNIEEYIKNVSDNFEKLYLKEASVIIDSKSSINTFEPIFMRSNILISLVINDKNFPYIVYKLNEYIDQFLKGSNTSLDENFKENLKSLLEKIKEGQNNSINTILEKITQTLDSNANSDFIKTELASHIEVEEFKEIFRGKRKDYGIDYMSINNFFKIYKGISDENSNKKTADIFKDYKRIYKANSNQAVMNYVVFDEDIEKIMKNFNEFYKNSILKSELVEKNDAKATFIIRRLFEAYVIDPHRLPNVALNSIWRIFTKFGKDDLQDIYKREFINLLKKMFIDPEGYKDLLVWEKDDVEKEKKYCTEGWQLYNEKVNLRKYLPQIELQNFELRSIIDNPILIASNKWKQSIYRGICDYIASLTDREALSEYEKLYYTTVELS